jgi:hypothetical protein
VTADGTTIPLGVVEGTWESDEMALRWAAAGMLCAQG